MAKTKHTITIEIESTSTVLRDKLLKENFPNGRVGFKIKGESNIGDEATLRVVGTSFDGRR